MKKAQKKVWCGTHHHPQFILMPFTIRWCTVVQQLCWLLRSGEPLQVKMTWTDIPQPKWDHILCKLCIQRLWFLYCWLTRAVWKSVTLGRNPALRLILALMHHYTATWAHKLRARHLRNSYSTNNCHHLFSRHTKNSNFNSVLKIRISPKGISKTNCSLITGIIFFPTF